tara:strand:- start:12837 stop:13520 length:684 start_codon:yes stop_codon:yes gene_type:complete
MYDLGIHGHLTVDHIFTTNGEKTTLGAIANFWQVIARLEPNLNIKVNPFCFGEALILINELKSQRVGRGDLNITIKHPVIPECKWHHIMYLNQLPMLHKIEWKSLGGEGRTPSKISADVTAGNIDCIIPYLKYIDYLFISDEELFMDVDELAKLTKGWVILHKPTGSYSSDGETHYNNFCERKSGLNVLGAGDIFAACFVSSMLFKDDVNAACKYAHQNTTEILKNG